MREATREGIYNFRIFVPKMLTCTLVHFICPALNCAFSGWRLKLHQCNFHFYLLKISFPSPENFLFDRAKHRARKISCATKNKNPTRGFLPHIPSLKRDWLYSFEKSTIFTTTISKIVLFSWQIFWKLYSYYFHYYSFFSFETSFPFNFSDFYYFENIISMVKSPISIEYSGCIDD